MKSLLTRTNLILLGTVLVLAWFLSAIQAILLPFILAVVLAYILHPLVVKLESRHLNTNLATTTVVSGFCLFVIALFLIIVPILQSQVLDFIRQIPKFSEHVWEFIKRMITLTKENIPQPQLADISDAVSGYVMNILTAIGAGLTQVLTGGVALFNILALILITPVVLFYILRDWKGIQMQVKNLIPKKQEEKVLSLWHDINQTLSGFIRGQSLVCLLLALFYGTALSLTGLQFGMLVGILAGILSFIPYFGFGTGLILSIFLALMQGFTWGQWTALAVIFIAGQILEGYILTPKLVGNRVGLHPVWIIFALLAGGALAGFIGILIAVPVAAVFGVLIRRFVRWYYQTDFYKGSRRS